MKLSDRELATVLAALRYYQRDLVDDGARFEHGDIATNGGALKPLDEFEIDALCERLNGIQTGARISAEVFKPSVYVFVRGGNVQGARSDRPVGVQVIDYDNAEAEGKSDEDFEREHLGCTFAELEKETRGVY